MKLGKRLLVRSQVIMTARPEFQSAWPTRVRVSQIFLRRLNAEEGRDLAASAAGDALDPAEINYIIDRADGVPLFIEELAREVAQRRRPASAPIPSTLRDLLMARLDRVREARPLLEIGALLGKSFVFGLLSAVAGQPGGEIERQLDLALDAEFLEMRGVVPLARLSFRHALIQEVVHESTLRQRRRELHRRIAEVMSTAFPELVERQPEIYAAHCGGGGLVREAIEAGAVLQVCRPHGLNLFYLGRFAEAQVLIGRA